MDLSLRKSALNVLTVVYVDTDREWARALPPSNPVVLNLRKK